MEHLDKLLEIVDGELTSISKNGKFRTRDEIDAAYKLIDIAKDIHCIWEYEEDEEILDGRGISNLVANGYLIEECEEI